VDKSEFIILIAEDDRIVQDVIVSFLTEEGYPVRVANDGLAALELLRLEDIKLVLTDLRMPGADGMEVLRSAIQINPRIAVVLLTAYGTLDTALEAMKEGAYDYIVKPFVMQQLLLVVRNAYKMASLIKENEKLTHQLKETYRNLETVRKISSQERKNVTDNSMESIETLKEQKVIDPNEAMMLKERLATGTVNENIKKYSSLVNDLKNK
jgi:DNA-binding NtrC family response regulator